LMSFSIEFARFEEKPISLIISAIFTGNISFLTIIAKMFSQHGINYSGDRGQNRKSLLQEFIGYNENIK